MDSSVSKHICRDRKMFKTLKTDREFAHFKLGNGGKIKIEGSMKMKLHDGVIRTFSNVRFVPFTIVKIIYVEEMTSQEYKYVGSK